MYVWMQLSPSVEHQLALGPAFGMTDIGTVRPSNEDNFLIDPQLGLVAVADGMGGHDAGEVASRDALLAMAEFLRASRVDDECDGPVMAPDERSVLSVIEQAVEFANGRMYQTNVDNQCISGRGMGTTLTGLWQPAANSQAVVFHVGDTRLYRMRDGRLDQLTRDQTLYQSAFDAGARRHLPPRNLLLQALGPGGVIKPELQTHQVAPGDLFMLCSDGLHGVVTDEHIAWVLARADAANLGASCARLIDIAKRRGSRDNITVVLFQSAR